MGETAVGEYNTKAMEHNLKRAKERNEERKRELRESFTPTFVVPPSAATSALVRAADAGDEVEIAVLLRYKPTLDGLATDGRSCIYTAALRRHESIVATLIAAGASVRTSCTKAQHRYGRHPPSSVPGRSHPVPALL